MSAPEAKPRACVVLLHGLGRTPRSLQRLQAALREYGYRVINPAYPSTRAGVERLAARVLPAALAACAGTVPLHFVTHSLGGILVRQYFQARPVPPGSRMVMLSPPNQGSEAAERMRRFAPARWLLGPALAQLGTGPDSLPAHLAPIDMEIGVITGERSLDLWFRHLFDGPHDGKVSVTRARLEGMRDFLVVPCSHPFIMRDTHVIGQVLFFLAHGQFNRHE
ncbi:MAG: hypothetical protein RLZ44_1854 [Pseudomonadota bacterium]